MDIKGISSIATTQAQGSAVTKVQAPVQAEPQEAMQVTEVQETTKPENNTTASSFNQNVTIGTNQDQATVHEQLKKKVEEINKNMTNSEAVFGFHEGTNRVTIKIVDKTSKKVIKELPPEKTLDMIARVWEMAGILVDEKR